LLRPAINAYVQVGDRRSVKRGYPAWRLRLEHQLTRGFVDEQALVEGCRQPRGRDDVARASGIRPDTQDADYPVGGKEDWNVGPLFSSDDRDVGHATSSTWTGVGAVTSPPPKFTGALYVAYR